MAVLNFDEEEGDGLGFGRQPFTDEEVREAFLTFDLNGNGYIGVSEIRFVLDALEEKVTDEEIDEMIRMLDVDGDGQVSFKEFYKMATGQSLAPIGVALPPPVSLAKQARLKEEEARGRPNTLLHKMAAPPPIPKKIDSFTGTSSSKKKKGAHDETSSRPSSSKTTSTNLKKVPQIFTGSLASKGEGGEEAHKSGRSQFAPAPAKYEEEKKLPKPKKKATVRDAENLEALIGIGGSGKDPGVNRGAELHQAKAESAQRKRVFVEYVKKFRADGKSLRNHYKLMRSKGLHEKPMADYNTYLSFMRTDDS